MMFWEVKGARTEKEEQRAKGPGKAACNDYEVRELVAGVAIARFCMGHAGTSMHVVISRCEGGGKGERGGRNGKGERIVC